MLFLSTLFAQLICNVFFDGTENNRTTGTNIWEMFSVLSGVPVVYDPKGLNKDNVDVLFKVDAVQHASVYVPGVGNSRTLSEAARIAQSASGAGMEKRAVIGYQFMLDQCETNLGANYEVKIFGFSRGACTARMFANYVARFGVVSSNTVPSTAADGLTPFEVTFTSISRANGPSVVGTRFPVIAFLGIYDTVCSIGVSRRLDPDNPRLFNLVPEGSLAKFPVKLNASIVRVAHAVAINEYRKFFQFTPIETSNPQWEETFFLGSHGDIGGFGSSARQKLSLSWMVNKGNFVTQTSLALSFHSLRNLRHSDMIDSNLETTAKVGGVENRVIDIARVHGTVKYVAADAKLPFINSLLDHDTAFNTIAGLKKSN